jgi:glycosyltransferase involved in cell wall biosynthesis
LIRSLDPLAGRRKFQLVFLGVPDKGDPYSTEFLSLVKERPWCTYAGFANRAELKAQLRQAALLVLPSLEDNCPMTVLEAMAAGVPVVAANVGGVPDLIEGGKTGIFCDPLEPASIAAGVEQLLADPAAAAGIAREARRRARERFLPEVVAQRHLEIYAEVRRAQR